MKKFESPLFFFFCIILMIISGCGNTSTQNSSAASPSHGTSSPSSASSSAPPQQLTVAAASDLSLVFKELGEVFENKYNTKVVFTFGSTGTLAQQIENGGPFDVFAAANVKFVDDLKAKDKIIEDTQQLYAQGRIGIATANSSSLQVNNMEELLDSKIKKIAIANPDHAPYGAAAKQALESAGLWDRVKDKMVYGNNITETYTLIKTGNADAGFIAQSLVKTDEVRFTLVDSKLYKPLDQAIAVVKGTSQEELARKFVQFVLEPDSQKLMQQYGFAPPASK